LCEAFSLFDKDGDGQITVDEVAQTMTSLGIDVQLSDVKAMVRQVDTDGKNVSDIVIHISIPASECLLSLSGPSIVHVIFSRLFVGC